jgi:hypothetical protein
MYPESGISHSAYLNDLDCYLLQVQAQVAKLIADTRLHSRKQFLLVARNFKTAQTKAVHHNDIVYNYATSSKVKLYPVLN